MTFKKDRQRILIVSIFLIVISAGTTVYAQGSVLTEVTGYSVAINHPPYNHDGAFYATILGEDGTHIIDAFVTPNIDKYLLNIIFEAREPNGYPIQWEIWDLEQYDTGSPLIGQYTPPVDSDDDPPIAHLTINPDDIIIGKKYGIFAGNLNTLYGTITFGQDPSIPEFPNLAYPMITLLILFIAIQKGILPNTRISV